MRQDNETGVDYNGRHYTMYEATQRQRKLERSIRSQKRKILVDEKTGDKEKLQTDQIRDQMLNQECKRFSKAAGLWLQHERLEVPGFGPKQAQAAEKAAQEYKIELENREKHDKMVSEIKSAGKLPASAKVHIPPQEVDVHSLSFDDAHINAQRGHNVTREQAEAWTQNAKMSATVWGGKYERYYSSDGCAYVGTVGKHRGVEPSQVFPGGRGPILRKTP